MYLKRIDVLGFKSFSDKTKIPFETGISCIVGPNGSGKSNIADAVRWVLGEQSAHSLRGGKFEDIIFAGSKKRKPLGMAEVTITFDNCDGHFKLPFAEVSLTRRTYRAGGSDYLINNQPSRLKDIHDLLLDSGVSLEGISLIGQGMINEIVTAQPEERRTIVEEAAGILKYRNRKKEAQRKLGQTSDSLLRVEDIISELADQLGPLAGQSAAAKQYLRFKEEAEQLEMALSWRVLSEAEGKLAELNSQVKELADEALRDEVARSHTEAQSEGLKLRINSLDEEITLLQQQFYHLEKERERLRSRAALEEVEKAAALKEEGRLQGELSELDCQLMKLSREEQTIKEQALALADQVREQEARISCGEGDEKSRRQAVALMEDKLEKAKNEAYELANILAECRNKLRYREQLRANNDAALFRLAKQKEEAQFKLDELEQKAKTETANLSLAQKKREDLKEKLAKISGQQKEQGEVLDKIVAEETSCRYEAHALASRLAMLKEMADSNEGYYPGVKSVLLAKNKGLAETEGVIDVVAKLLDVPEKYLTAVETYLSSSLQNIVTKDEAAAKKAIRYLKENSLGRATFLPLDTIKARKAPDLQRYAGHQAVYGIASELVGYPAKLRPAVEFLLSQAVLVEDLDTAAAVARALDYRYSVVTLDGEMVNPGASMTGGRGQKNNNDILTKLNQLKKTAAELTAAQERLAEQTEALGRERASAARLEEKAASLIAAHKELAEALRQGEQALEQIGLERALHHKQEAGVAMEIAGLERSNGDIAIEIDEIMESLTQEEERDAAVKDAILTLQEELNKRQNDLDSDREDINRCKVELARAQQTLAEWQRALERIANDKDNLAWSKEEKDADLSQVKNKLAEDERTLAQGRQALLDLEMEIKEKEDTLNGKRHGLTAEMNELELLEKTAKDLSRRVREKEDALHQLELKKTRLETEWENEQRKVEEKFELTFSELKLRVKEETLAQAPREQSRRLAELRREIAALGTVNIGAIEEYEERSGRYNFLSEQRADLLQAKEALDRVIDEMDKIMISRFRTTCKKLSEEFNNCFGRLFDGGRAALTLTDPDNLLETGVEIEVQIPGKKVNNYNLLSGGEKALCGIALLFAVLSVKPTPFCLMDEVDSALDETNVDRFADFLKDLSATTQFLMITHRQGTMEAASSLWGVTMEEEGVSKLISLKLPDFAAEEKDVKIFRGKEKAV